MFIVRGAAARLEWRRGRVRSSRARARDRVSSTASVGPPSRARTASMRALTAAGPCPSRGPACPQPTLEHRRRLLLGVRRHGHDALLSSLGVVGTSGHPPSSTGAGRPPMTAPERSPRAPVSEAAPPARARAVRPWIGRDDGGQPPSTESGSGDRPARSPGRRSVDAAVIARGQMIAAALPFGSKRNVRLVVSLARSTVAPTDRTCRPRSPGPSPAARS